MDEFALGRGSKLLSHKEFRAVLPYRRGRGSGNVTLPETLHSDLAVLRNVQASVGHCETAEAAEDPGCAQIERGRPVRHAHAKEIRAFYVLETEGRARVRCFCCNLNVAHFEVAHVAKIEARRGEIAKHGRLRLGIVLDGRR